jgi:zinc protease
LVKISNKILSFLILLFKSQITLSNELPIDPSIQKGTFENGLTYYIKENSKPENKAELRLVIKAGSMMEEERQRGLAHLLEHVAFNGSKNFPKNSIDDYFNSIGLNLGSHFNAYTGFDTTSYDIEIPTDVDKALDQGLLFLSDIIRNLDLTDESFEKERKIVEEEILSDLTAGTKYTDLFIGELLQGSRYPQRFPRGDLEVIRNFEYQDVKDYYNLWYQPENVGLFVVGDFKKEEVFKIIEKHFSKIPNQKINKQIDFTVPDYTEDKFLRYQDEKEDQIEFSIYKKNEFRKINTKENYRNNILRV